MKITIIKVILYIICKNIFLYFGYKYTDSFKDYVPGDQVIKSTDSDDDNNDGVSDKKGVEHSSSSESGNDNDNSDNKKIKHKLKINRTIFNHKNCIVCGHQFRKISSKHSLETPKKRTGLEQCINREAKNEAFIRTGILIPDTSRACPEHFSEKKLLNEEAIMMLSSFTDYVNLSSKETENLIEDLRVS